MPRIDLSFGSNAQPKTEDNAFKVSLALALQSDAGKAVVVDGLGKIPLMAICIFTVCMFGLCNF